MAQKKVSDFKNLVGLLKPLTHKKPCLIALDGRPCSGKTTTALKPAQELDAHLMHFDEFFIPSSEWPETIEPSFPFLYMRHDEFKACLEKLAQGLPCTYFRYDPQHNDISRIPTTLSPHKPIIIEGVSTLAGDLAPLYTFTIFIESTQEASLEALYKREQNMSLWHSMYLPSIELYLQEKPWERADTLFAGRIM